MRTRACARPTHEHANNTCDGLNEHHLRHVCMVMHNTVFIPLYHSICVHSCSSFPFLCSPPSSLSLSSLSHPLIYILHLPIEDHGLAYLLFAFIQTNKQTSEARKIKTNLVCSHTRPQPQPHFLRISLHSHAINHFLFFSRPLFVSRASTTIKKFNLALWEFVAAAHISSAISVSCI